MFAVFRSMRTPHDGLARDFGPGPIPGYEARRGADSSSGLTAAANDNGTRVPVSRSALPPDALAIIEPVPLATNQGGRALQGKWRLRFAERSAPFVDPLTGWTGGSDPLAHVELRFPNLAAAERYCRTQQLGFEIRSAPPAGAARRWSAPADLGPPVLAWPTAHTVGAAP